MFTTLLLMIRNILEVLGEAVASVLFFFGLQPETLHGLNLGHFEVGFVVAVLTIVVSILSIEAYRKFRNRSRS